MPNMTTSGSLSEFERVFGQLTTAEPQPERRLDVIVREGLARIDQVVERVSESYKAPQIEAEQTFMVLGCQLQRGLLCGCEIVDSHSHTDWLAPRHANSLD